MQGVAHLFQPFLLVNKEQGGEAPFRINQHQKLLDRVHHPLGQGQACQNKFTTTAPEKDKVCTGELYTAHPLGTTGVEQK